MKAEVILSQEPNGVLGAFRVFLDNNVRLESAFIIKPEQGINEMQKSINKTLLDMFDAINRCNKLPEETAMHTLGPQISNTMEKTNDIEFWMLRCMGCKVQESYFVRDFITKEVLGHIVWDEKIRGFLYQKERGVILSKSQQGKITKFIKIKTKQGYKNISRDDRKYNKSQIENQMKRMALSLNK